MNPHHLPRLQSLLHENPTKRISLIRLAWPDIEKALARGHTLKLVHARPTDGRWTRDQLQPALPLRATSSRQGTFQERPTASNHRSESRSDYSGRESPAGESGAESRKRIGAAGFTEKCGRKSCERARLLPSERIDGRERQRPGWRALFFQRTCSRYQRIVSSNQIDLGGR